ncbi:hypothetical protein SynMVIR181_01968 [Synechococcus sp. MVIR-18-1]|nr:hypothetical protein SynMVIR181_01968 [Synechococcus sp. MVIR-18-1]
MLDRALSAQFDAEDPNLNQNLSNDLTYKFMHQLSAGRGRANPHRSMIEPLRAIQQD